MENIFGIFPHYGKIFSTLWKKRAIFSTQWKNFSQVFHTMERICPKCGKLGFRAVFWRFRAVSRAVERSTRRPLSAVERARPRGRENGDRRRRSAPSAAAASGAAYGAAVFLAARSGGLRALRCEGGVAGGADLIGGLLKIPRGLRDHAAEGRRPDPSPERVCAVGTVPGAVQSPRLAG